MTNPDMPTLEQLRLYQDPWRWSAGDYRGKQIRITVNWDSSNGNLMDAIVWRDSECMYKKIYFGLGPDGTVETSPDQWEIPAGETLVRSQFLKKARLRTIYDVLTLQITAGP